MGAKDGAKDQTGTTVENDGDRAANGGDRAANGVCGAGAAKKATGGGLAVSIIGLGLIGGSFAYALRGFRNCTLTGYDIDAYTTAQALAKGAIDRAAVSLGDAARGADLVLFCTAPDAVQKNARACASELKDGAVVVEICGVKREISAALVSLLPERVDYIGVHPMAGKEVGGFVNAAPDLFHKAGFILILPERRRKASLDLVEELCRHVGAGRVCHNSPEDHDRIIAYTSDLMHISATALCAAFPADMTMAHTAGAFRDCTRIANIDAALWTELLQKNAEYILPHLHSYIESLSRVHETLKTGDADALHDFLSRACANKKEMTRL
jgi:prephenate dehydrogenase